MPGIYVILAPRTYRADFWDKNINLFSMHTSDPSPPLPANSIRTAMLTHFARYCDRHRQPARGPLLAPVGHGLVPSFAAEERAQYS